MNCLKNSNLYAGATFHHLHVDHYRLFISEWSVCYIVKSGMVIRNKHVISHIMNVQHNKTLNSLRPT